LAVKLYVSRDILFSFKEESKSFFILEESPMFSRRGVHLEIFDQLLSIIVERKATRKLVLKISINERDKEMIW